MYLKYADNFKFTLETGKSAATNYFTVTWVSDNNQTFVNAFENNPILQDGKSAFAVPITLLDASENVVASGYATHWNWEDTGNEAKVYVSATLTAAAASVGYKLACRYRAVAATIASLTSSLIDEWTINTAALSSPFYGDIPIWAAHSFIVVEVSGGTIKIPPSDYLSSVIPEYWTPDIVAQLPRYTVCLKDGAGTQPTFSWGISSPSAYDSIVWEGGSAPTFDVSNNCIVVELRLGCRNPARWLGKWTRFNAA